MSFLRFHATRQRKIHYSELDAPLTTVADFYNRFLVSDQRLPDPQVVEAWHDLLVQYINDPTAKIFPVRKYESKKEHKAWNNRRGAVIRFADGFEVVYASNFLAHEIYLMAHHGFVPTYADFKQCLEDRTLPITNGTEVERHISLYPSANKTCGCYLAHIMDVNGHYEQEDKTYLPLSTAETARLYPLGTPEDWMLSSDKIMHLDYALNDEEKALIKAHFLRFLDPMNYYVTPETKHGRHTIPGWTKNIGEYPYLTYCVQEQYKALYGSRYAQLLTLGKFREEMPAGYTGKDVINFTIDFSGLPSPKPPAKHRTPAPSICTYSPADMGDFKKAFLHKGEARITITYIDGSTEQRVWLCRNITQTSNIKGNLTSKAWYRENKSRFQHVLCEVI